MPATGQLYIGTAGWSYKDWEGRFYPEKGIKPADRLIYYSDYFNTVEVNSSFYHIPPPKYAEGWIKKVEKNQSFLFTMKLWQGFTHSGEYPSKNEIEYFISTTGALESAGKLGAVLVQFPWSFKNEDKNLDRIKRIKDDFGRFPLVVEVRHKSWETEEFISFLGENGINFCNIDQPVIGASIAPTEITTAELGYVRLHGRNYEKWFSSDHDPAQRYNYLYKEDEINSWVERIKNILGRNKPAFIVANNHWHGKAAHTALKIKNKVKEEKVKVPEKLEQTYPDLEEISETRNGQTDLL